jgi:nickel-dependent lactate racemase
VIVPGIAHADTITTFHSHRFMAHPRAANCVLDGNPLHEEQLAIVRMLGGALALNTVIDDRRRLAFVNFGEIVASHLAAVAFLRRYAEVEVDRRFSTVVTSGAGHPLDQNFYQTVKGIVGAMDIVSEGGDLVIASQCAEGLGSPEFAAAQRRYLELGAERFLAEIAQQSHAAIDEWETQMLLRPRARIWLHSGLDAAARRLCGVECIDSVADAIAASLARHQSRELAVIPEGPYVVPFVRCGGPGLSAPSR